MSRPPMSTPPSDDRAAASTRAVELVVASLIALFGLIVIADSIRLGFGWGSDGPQASYFPFYIGAFICIASAIIFVSAFKKPALAA